MPAGSSTYGFQEESRPREARPKDSFIATASLDGAGQGFGVRFMFMVFLEELLQASLRIPFGVSINACGIF